MDLTDTTINETEWISCRISNMESRSGTNNDAFIPSTGMCLISCGCLRLQICRRVVSGSTHSQVPTQTSYNKIKHTTVLLPFSRHTF